MLGIYPSGCKCPFPEPRFTIFEPRSQLCGSKIASREPKTEHFRFQKQILNMLL
ncbi:MAG: hypothetical protein ACI8VT_003982, partial [Saprospiraceae bacterium]